MKLSQSASITSKSTSHDEGSVNARLLTQAGFIRREAAGVYSYLPFGLRVLNRISQIVREEMDAIGAQELLMPALTPISAWQKTGRENIDIAYRPDEKTVLGWTHEEIVTPLAAQRIQSYRDLPLAVYQIQNKFRNEPRAKSGLLRGREFLMKDLYSFHASQADLDEYYERIKHAYLRVYERCGLTAYVVAASGGHFTKKYSHEFQVLTDAGEDRILLCEPCGLAWNSELEVTQCGKCGGELREAKGAEVGNIFDLGTRFTEPCGVRYSAEDGSQKIPVMGCYGIGVSRLLAVIAEIHHDDAGLSWPASVAPFAMQLIGYGEQGLAAASQLYAELTAAGVSTLYDDRAKASMGERLADADLIGCPLRVVVSDRSLAAGGAEVKLRTASECQIAPISEVLATTQKI